MVAPARINRVIEDAGLDDSGRITCFLGDDVAVNVEVLQSINCTCFGVGSAICLCPPDSVHAIRHSITINLHVRRV